MRLTCLLFLLASCLPALADPAFERTPYLVKIPYMERAGLHRHYTEELLQLALDRSEERYGPYEVIQQSAQTVIRRQLLALQQGDELSVAISMPMPEWQRNARMIPIPLMKGLASYRLFFSHRENLDRFNAIENLEELKSLRVGQGPGWSTAKILEDHGFQVIYGGPYKTLFPMLHGGRFDLLMRGVYEIQPELDAYLPEMPELAIVDGFAVYTYLPMYFFVSEQQPELAERLTYGLQQAHVTGEWDRLFYRYFNDTLRLLNLERRRLFYLRNTNIDGSYYENDKPYLLDSIVTLESKRH